MLNATENFSQEEIKKLSPFVTNCDKSIFALRNLPEVIKGALFSKYSRSNLGLRELLLKDFIGSENSGFNEIAGEAGKADGTDKQEAAIKKAEEFYNRVLDGYGDDSIGELGGAHLALENISMVASKIIEDARIGGSPLEKSTCYIFFDKKINGDYRYLKEPALMASSHKELYLSACRNLFDTYSALIPRVKSYIETKLIREEGVSETAYKTSLHAKVCDALRGLLPASTLTNVGFFGNGRFFETLLQKLLVNDLTELNEIGKSSHTELSKVMPSFVRRAREGHKHFDIWADFYKTQKNSLKKQAINLLQNRQTPFDREVTLIQADDLAVQKVAAALLYEHSTLSLGDILNEVKSYSNETLSDIFKASYDARTNRRHKPPRALEHAEYVFDLMGDFGMFRDLHRHRILTQERQLLSTHYGYNIPEDIVLSGAQKEYSRAMEQARLVYEIISPDFQHEAQYVVPMAYRIRWYFKINLRSLIWMTELRSAPQGHENYRRMAQSMARAVMDKQPLLAPFFKFVDFNSYELGRLSQEIRKEEKKVNQSK